jgi:hypothetical protein
MASDSAYANKRYDPHYCEPHNVFGNQQVVCNNENGEPMLPEEAIVYSRLKPGHVAGSDIGMEIVTWEERLKSQKFAFDIRTFFKWTSEGRDYTEISDILGEITYHQQFLTIGASLGLNIQASRYVQFRTSVAFNYTTMHLITREPTGNDIGRYCDEDDVECDPSEPNKEIDKRPYWLNGEWVSEENSDYDEYVDQVGRRFSIKGKFGFVWLVTGAFTF